MKRNPEIHETLDYDFRPNLSPKEVLQQGSFGGTYFRPIYSSVTKQKWVSLLVTFMLLLLLLNVNDPGMGRRSGRSCLRTGWKGSISEPR